MKSLVTILSLVLLTSGMSPAVAKTCRMGRQAHRSDCCPPRMESSSAQVESSCCTFQKSLPANQEAAVQIAPESGSLPSVAIPPAGAHLFRAHDRLPPRPYSTAGPPVALFLKNGSLRI